MAKNVLPKHWNGSEFEELHIVTKASNVFTNDNKSVQQKIDDFTSHLADDTIHVIKDGTLQTGLNSEMLGGKTFDKFVLAESTIQTRIYNGIFQYYDNGEWKDVSVIANTFCTADFAQENVAPNTWLTALNIIGKGVLYRISGAFGDSNLSNKFLEIEVTVDDVVQSVTVPRDISTRGIGGDDSRWRNQLMDIITHIKFDSSLQVRIKHSDSSARILFCTIDYGLI